MTTSLHGGPAGLLDPVHPYECTPQAIALPYQFRFDLPKAEGEGIEHPACLTDDDLVAALPGRRMDIARLALTHINWALGRASGGVYDDAGDRWTYQSVGDFVASITRAAAGFLSRFLPSRRTIERALSALASLGIVRREWVQIGEGRTAFTCYAYTHGPHWNVAVERLAADADSVTRGLVTVPGGSVNGDHHAEQFSRTTSARPGRRREQPGPTLYQSQGGQLFERPEWNTFQGVPETEIFTRIDAQKTQEQPSPAMPDTPYAEPGEQPLQLDSRPISDPVQSEGGTVTEEDSASPALIALNTAASRGWQWDAGLGKFRSPAAPCLLPVSVEEIASRYGVDAVELRQILEGARHDRG